MSKKVVFKNIIQEHPGRPWPSRPCPGRMLQVVGAKGMENYSDELEAYLKSDNLQYNTLVR